MRLEPFFRLVCCLAQTQSATQFAQGWQSDDLQDPNKFSDLSANHREASAEYIVVY